MLVRALALVCALLLPVSAFANPAPRIKPDRPNHSQYLDDHDAEMLRSGMRAASDGDWAEVRSFRQRLSDPVARNILLWRIATSDASASFFDLDLALTELEGWPQYTNIQREAEFKIGTSGLTAAFINGWFQLHPPLSGEGKIAFGEALLVMGQRNAGAEQIRDAWRNHSLRLYRQREVLDSHRSLLRQEDHQARVDMLIWTNQYSAARGVIGELDSAWRTLSNARIALAGRSGNVNAAVAAVPASLSNHPGLVYERARWRRRANLDDGALEMLRDLPGEYYLDSALEDMWLERRLAILNLIRDRDYATAYELAAANGMSSGADFADAEFVAGWLALRYLNRPQDALQHFTRLAEGVSYPVSVSRGRYWQGRAAEAAGDATAARGYYEQAAEHGTTFYGQMAMVELAGGETPMFDLPPQPVPTAEERAAFESRPVTRALRLLAEMDEDYYFTVFSYHLDDELETSAQSLLLTELAYDYLRRRQAVRAAKAASYRWNILAEASYPVIDLPRSSTVALPEPALVHGIIRQETEFDPGAVSGAGARGMMQMMPATARATARQLGMPYRFDWLTYDAEYNMRLGQRHLQDVINENYGSYIIALAAYNAGGHRTDRWIEDYGDPRAAGVDPIDWIESIPFSETRNYVQRVIENTQVYRWRLNNNQPVPLTILEDINRGSPNF
ncbi:lytic transglycosylase domain-containing protein [Hyphobacterium marinum]|uniref:Lytic transglycosylase domain-containing protein n=1 Tax=Hyphobacterium marinum TaxID=3116574 RepID=A0ABU7LYW1_9PROT|nr:lytic transglycosylase domain-containing protein [Hyphobacterium sp. Y6023]MEE2566718.1 lytic transglycosylase domain-containing protein [Hyphobacterium sp. Y6023]